MTSRSRSRFRWPVLLGLLTLVVTACADNRQDTFDPRGEDARSIHFLTKLTGGIATIVGIIVAVMVVLAIVKFRSRPGTEDELPKQIHGNLRAEVLWTIAPGVLLAALAIPTVTTLFDITETGTGTMEIGVEGNQWWWQYTYDLDGDGTVDITTANDIVFPAGEFIDLKIESNDVIHSFWIPELNGKRDAVPGRTHNWRIQADEPGMYWGQCTEYCGLSHAVMRMRAVALSPADWEAWTAQQLQAAAVPADGTEAAEGAALFNQFCTTCHVVNGSYETALDRSTVPLQSGVAPNLTHMLSRTSFAGSLFNMYNDNGTLNEGQLRQWVWDAPSMKPLAPENQQGMISFRDQLDRQQLDLIIQYLKTLGEEPILPDGVPITGE